MRNNEQVTEECESASDPSIPHATWDLHVGSNRRTPAMMGNDAEGQAHHDDENDRTVSAAFASLRDVPVSLHVPSKPDRASVDDNLSQIRNSLIALLNDHDTVALLQRAAERYARVPRGSLVARELVADVVGDLYAGTAKLNSDHAQLATQLLDEMHQRAKRARKRSEHDVPIDELDNDEIPWREIRVERLDDRSAAVLRQLLGEARAVVGEDVSARELIALYEMGVVRKRDILRLGMPEGVYRAARARVLSALRACARRAEAEQSSERQGYRCANPERAISALGALRRFGTLWMERDRGHGCTAAPRHITVARKR